MNYCKSRAIIAAALNTDMGVTIPISLTLDSETTGGAPELDEMTRYVSLLGVSARRDLTNAEALRGEQLFASAHCVKCPVPTLTTSPYHFMTELRSQTIHPTPTCSCTTWGPVSPSNWEKVPPSLWSIGLTAGVNGGETYLHDGRARSREKAILWHAGEADGGKEAFRTMSAADRGALTLFLKSL